MNNLEKPAMEAHSKSERYEITENHSSKGWKKENEKEKPLPWIEPGPLPSRNGAPLPLDHRDS